MEKYRCKYALIGLVLVIIALIVCTFLITNSLSQLREDTIKFIALMVWIILVGCTLWAMFHFLMLILGPLISSDDKKWYERHPVLLGIICSALVVLGVIIGTAFQPIIQTVIQSFFAK